MTLLNKNFQLEPKLEKYWKKMEKETDTLEEQYINHPYPKPIENMDEMIKYNYI